MNDTIDPNIPGHQIILFKNNELLFRMKYLELTFPNTNIICTEESEGILLPDVWRRTDFTIWGKGEISGQQQDISLPLDNLTLEIYIDGELKLKGSRVRASNSSKERRTSAGVIYYQPLVLIEIGVWDAIQ